jgi:hypothetical protein
MIIYNRETRQFSYSSDWMDKKKESDLKYAKYKYSPGVEKRQYKLDFTKNKTENGRNDKQFNRV